MARGSGRVCRRSENTEGTDTTVPRNGILSSWKDDTVITVNPSSTSTMYLDRLALLVLLVETYSRSLSLDLLASSFPTITTLKLEQVFSLPKLQP